MYFDHGRGKYGFIIFVGCNSLARLILTELRSTHSHIHVAHYTCKLSCFVYTCRPLGCRSWFDTRRVCVELCYVGQVDFSGRGCGRVQTRSVISIVHYTELFLLIAKYVSLLSRA